MIKINQKGIISVYVLGVMLLFLFIVMGIYNITSKKYEVQSEIIKKTIETYNKNTIINDI